MQQNSHLTSTGILQALSDDIQSTLWIRSITERFSYKLCLLTYKALNRLTPRCIADFRKPVASIVSWSSLHSAGAEHERSYRVKGLERTVSGRSHG